MSNRDELLAGSPGIPELRVSIMARAIRASLKSYGHGVWDSSLPECIASDVEHALSSSEAPQAAQPGGVEARFRSRAFAERKFTNSVGNEIEIFVATGNAENCLCRTSMYGPDSGFDNYSTWDELVQMHSALSEVLALSTPTEGPLWLDSLRQADAILAFCQAAQPGGVEAAFSRATDPSDEQWKEWVSTTPTEGNGPAFVDGALREAAKALVAKIAECAPHIDNNFAFTHARGVAYSGPNFGKELKALEAALSPDAPVLEQGPA